MFLIKKNRAAKSGTWSYHILPALAVLTALLFLSGWVNHNARQSLRTEVEANLTQRIQRSNNAILGRLEAYSVILQSGASLFVASDEVSKQDWHNFTQNFSLEENYPGIYGVGYAAALRPSQIRSFTEQMRQDAYPDFNIFPEDRRDYYTTITLLEPLDEHNKLAIGYDMYTDPVRRAAMDRARQTGEPSLSGKVQLVQTVDSPEETGFLLYTPVYTPATFNKPEVSQRQLMGFSYAPFVSSDFFQDIGIRDNSEHRQFRIYADEANDQGLLYQTADFDSPAYRDGGFERRQTLDVYGRQWIIDYRYAADIISPQLRRRPVATLISSVMLSFLLSGFVLALLVGRTRALSVLEAQELQAAKDELLSLASHQLRTPATGVKQYIGMLREGFAGKLTAKQTKLVERAYESNERQLGIINTLLYVAKVDAEGIVLSKRSVNISALVKDVIDEQLKEIERRRHNVLVNMPKRNVYAVVDEQCIRMVIENLINNASKYSFDAADITVTVKASKNTVSISVSDTGIGISQEELQLLFRRFSRIPNELSQQSSGSGIGLYLSRKLVELHGGTLTVESTKGEGSTFTVEFPRR